MAPAAIRRRAPQRCRLDVLPAPRGKITDEDQRGVEPPGWSRHLLVRRSLTRNAKGEPELSYYLCWPRPGRPTRS